MVDGGDSAGEGLMGASRLSLRVQSDEYASFSGSCKPLSPILRYYRLMIFALVIATFAKSFEDSYKPLILI